MKDIYTFEKNLNGSRSPFWTEYPPEGGYHNQLTLNDEMDSVTFTMRTETEVPPGAKTANRPKVSISTDVRMSYEDLARLGFHVQQILDNAAARKAEGR